MSEPQKKHKTMSNPVSWWILNILTTCFLATAIAAFAIRASRPSAQGSNAGDVRVFRLGHGLAEDHVVHKAMLQMAERVKELSGGTMEIQIFPNSLLGSEDECFKQAQSAQIDFSKCSASVLDGTAVTAFQVVGAPFLFRDSEHFWAVMDGEIGQSLLKDLEKINLVGICFFDAGARSVYSVEKKPVRTPDDMKGLKIRTQKSSIAMNSMEALGAAPTPISWGELYTALSQGTVDAAENNIPSFVSGRHFEVCTNFSFTEHQRVPDVLVMSKKIWDSLTPEQQGWIKQAAAEANVSQRKAWLESEIECEKKARDAGVNFIKVDRTPFITLSQPIYDKFSPELQELARRIKAVGLDEGQKNPESQAPSPDKK